MKANKYQPLTEISCEPLPKKQRPKLTRRQLRAFYGYLYYGSGAVDAAFDDAKEWLLEVSRLRHLVPVEAVAASSEDSYNAFYRENAPMFKTWEELGRPTSTGGSGNTLTQREYTRAAAEQAKWEEEQLERRHALTKESDQKWELEEKRRSTASKRDVPPLLLIHLGKK
jgi:hypothetical protein